MEQNKVIDNAALEQAVKDFVADQSKDHMAKLLAAMHPAQLLVPAVFPKDMDMSLLEKLPKDQPAKLPEGVKLIPAVLKNSEGDSYFPVFTGKGQIPKNQKYPAVLCFPYVQCRDLIDKSEGKIRAMVVNPFTDNLILNPAFFEATKRAEAAIARPKTVKMSMPQFHHMVRMQVERGMLPQLLAQNPEQGVEKLSEEREEFVFSLFDRAYEPGSVANPYKMEEFSSMVLDLSDTMRYISIKLPEKNLTKGACRAIYVAWNSVEKRYAYYLAEQGDDRQASLLQICGPKDIRNLGAAPGEGEEIRRIMEVFEQ